MTPPLLAALRLAWLRRPLAGEPPDPIVDYAHQRLPLGSAIGGLEDQAHRAREKVESALVQWATTGRWRALPRGGATYLEEALRSALARYREPAPQRRTKAVRGGPDLSTDEATALCDATVGEWYRTGLRPWAEERAREWCEHQDSYLGWD